MVLVTNCRFPGKQYTLLSVEYTNGKKIYNVKDANGRKFTFESEYCTLGVSTAGLDKKVSCWYH